MNINQAGMDADFMTDAMVEAASMFEEVVTIKRWTSLTGGNDAQSLEPTDNYANISTTANITALVAQEVNYPGSIYAMGDLKAEFRVPIFGEESQAGDGQTPGRKADQVIYRGRLYKIVGHVEKPFLQSPLYYKAVLRQV